MKKIKKEKPSKNIDEINGRKRTLFFLLLSFVLVIGSVATAVILPYIETLPVYQSRTAVYDSSLVTTETALDVENKLTFTIEENYSLTFSSSDSNVLAGTTETKYIFADKGGADSSVSMKFTFNSGDIRFVKFKLFTCNASGTSIYEIDDKTKISYEKDDHDFITMTYVSSSHIYIHKVIVSYQLRVKN